jgi:hypothetical protein
MSNRSGSQGESGSKNRGTTHSEHDTRSSSSTQPRSSGSGPNANSPHDERHDSGEMGPMHTNAGNTGFSSDQISPKTQNLPQTGPSASHPATHKDSSDRSS